MIYLDNAATTKPSKKCLEAARKFNDEAFFNPSALYLGGLSNAREIRNAKESILNNLGAVNFDVIFTSCGTESDNTAIFGVCKRGKFVTTKGEHSAVYKSFLELKNKGFEVDFIDINSDGTVNTNKLYKYVEENKPDFVSIVHVNNETGGVNDVNAISKTIKTLSPKTIFHSDGVQAYGKISFKLSNTVDLYSISAHKINALKGTGALIKRKGINVSPLIVGGGQENGLRSGTENIFGIKMFEYAGNIHYASIRDNFNKVKMLNDKMRNGLSQELFTVISGKDASPYILTVSAKGLKGEVIMHALETRKIIVGNGSACSSKNRFSRVLQSAGYKNDVLDGIIRISFSTENTLEEIEYVVNELNSVAEKFKGII